MRQSEEIRHIHIPMDFYIKTMISDRPKPQQSRAKPRGHGFGNPIRQLVHSSFVVLIFYSTMLHIELFIHYRLLLEYPWISQHTHSEYIPHTYRHLSCVFTIIRPLLFISHITCITNSTRPIYLHYPDVSTTYEPAKHFISCTSCLPYVGRLSHHRLSSHPSFVKPSDK